MARFDAFRLADGMLVVDCQADLLSHLKTRLVVPLFPEEQVSRPIARLNPIVNLAGADLLFCADLAASVPLQDLGEQIASLEKDSDQLSAALDMLLIGF
jgi:toxin CcdB